MTLTYFQIAVDQVQPYLEQVKKQEKEMLEQMKRPQKSSSKPAAFMGGKNMFGVGTSHR